jgi:hypothetical protein
MGKDPNGKFIPPKGKPSGDGNSKAGLKPVNDWENLEEQLDKEDIYTDGPDMPAANVRVRHPNRNVDKEDTNQAYS